MPKRQRSDRGGPDPDPLKPWESVETYTQDNDSCDSGDDGQELTVKVLNAGGGPYVVIETPRWAINPEDIDKWAKKLKRVLKRHKEEV